MIDLLLFIGLWWALRRRVSAGRATAPNVVDAHWIWPLADETGRRAGRITSGFSARHPGVDIAIHGEYKSGPPRTVRSVADGQVIASRFTPRGGEVVIAHGDWASHHDYRTSYDHLATVTASAGQVVHAGDALGTMGSDPLDPEGVRHLHLQVGVGNAMIDPTPYLDTAT